MKKILAILLGLLLITGCSKNSEAMSVEETEDLIEVEEESVLEEDKELVSEEVVLVSTEEAEEKVEEETEEKEIIKEEKFETSKVEDTEEKTPKEIKNPHLELKDKVMGIWTYEDNEGYIEEFRIKITDLQIVQYIVNSEILADGSYEITSYDPESKELSIKGPLDIVSIKLIDDKTIEIKSNEGMVSTWHYLYGLDEGFEY